MCGEGGGRDSKELSTLNRNLQPSPLQQLVLDTQVRWCQKPNTHGRKEDLNRAEHRAWTLGVHKRVLLTPQGRLPGGREGEAKSEPEGGGGPSGGSGGEDRGRWGSSMVPA